MPARLAAIVGVIVWVASPALLAQSAPKLNRAQRDLLQAVVAAVDAAAAAPETPGAGWQIHVLRTSDGAHYVAFTVTPSPELSVSTPETVYVRLATQRDPRALTIASERSAVMEWLKGMRSDPLVAQRQRGIAFGEMPVFGAGGIAVRGPGQQSSDLALLSLERERARERKEAAERERKAALEGASTNRARDAVFPFEDFTVSSAQANTLEPPGLLRRSVTAGPGEYDLYVAWAEPVTRGHPPAIRVVKRGLALAPASTADLMISSVILAEQISVRESALPPDQQSSRPYAIGPMEITPVREEIFTNDQQLAVVFQVLNARPDETGKPDVAIGLQLMRQTSAGDVSAGMLKPLSYNATTLPPDFDLTKGHPLFAATTASLKSLPRGDYRLRISAVDKRSGRNTGAEATLRIAATPSTLLTSAPLATRFTREWLLAPSVLDRVAASLGGGQPSPALAAALDAARAGRFIDLLRDDASAGDEHGIRATLRGIGLYGLGDPRLASTMLRQAVAAAPTAAAQLYLGACRALEGNDREAIAAWQAALDLGMPPALMTPLLIEAHLRLGDVPRAATMTESIALGEHADAALLRSMATVHIAQGRDAEAIATLDTHVAVADTDPDTQYVLLRALFALLVKGQQEAAPELRARFESIATRYLEANGRHAALVAEWREVIK